MYLCTQCMNTELTEFASLCFSGLRLHGGFPPTAAPGTIPDKSSYRLVVVCYPPSLILDGQGVNSFGSLSNHGLLTIPPEATHPE